MQKMIPESEIRQLMKKRNIPGMSIVIIENAEIVSHGGYGLKNSETDDLVNDNTVFEAASLSKPVFAYGVLQMVEEGLLNLDKPLVEYLAYSDVENDERLKRITARMALSHATGFPNWRGHGNLLKIYFQPGKKFSYSGEGFVYLQKVVERLLGRSMQEYLQEKVFQPLGMDHSSFVWQRSYEKLKASGHDADGRPLTISLKREPANAAFTLHTTALDYAKFVIAVLKDMGLKHETVNEMMTTQIRVDAGCVNCIHKPLGKLSDSISWGLGWGLQGDSFWHWGDNPGFKNYIVGSRREKKGMIIFTNSSNGLSIIPEIIYKVWGTLQPALDWVNADKVPF